jgi:hypothetical protein
LQRTALVENSKRYSKQSIAPESDGWLGRFAGFKSEYRLSGFARDLHKYSPCDAAFISASLLLQPIQPSEQNSLPAEFNQQFRLVKDFCQLLGMIRFSVERQHALGRGGPSVRSELAGLLSATR